MANDNIKLTLLDGKVFDMPIINANSGPSALDVRALYSNTGMFTYDPGFFSTSSCKSSVAFIDGDKGILRYRGIDIIDLATQSNFIDVAYLLFYGKKPNTEEYSNFLNKIKEHSFVDTEVINAIYCLPNNTHPMAMMMTAFTVLMCIYSHYDVEESYALALAKAPYIVAVIYHYLHHEEFKFNQYKYDDYCKNFLYLLSPTLAESDVIVDAIDKFCILHADHEQNASTSTARMVASTQASPLAAVSSAIGALWGKAHGGANEALLVMLQGIKNINEVPSLIKRAKDPDDSFRIMGFGHRVYKNYDPRATVLKEVCNNVLNSIDNNNEYELFAIARKLEEIALNDDYFISRKLYPNVDFYSGIVMKSIGIPVNMFTTIFSMARTSGWLSQIREMTKDSEQKLYRPRQVYIGESPNKK